MKANYMLRILTFALAGTLTATAIFAQDKDTRLKKSGNQMSGDMHQSMPDRGNHGPMDDKMGVKKPANDNQNGNLNLGAVVTIMAVTKDDAGAKDNPNGAGRLVPVKVEYRTKVTPGAKVLEMEAVLKTTNTDGSMTEVKKMLEFSKTMETLMLPMPEGVFAKEFTLMINSKCSLPDNKGMASSKVNKSGTFPILPR